VSDREMEKMVMKSHGDALTSLVGTGFNDVVRKEPAKKAKRMKQKIRFNKDQIEVLENATDPDALALALAYRSRSETNLLQQDRIKENLTFGRTRDSKLTERFMNTIRFKDKTLMHEAESKSRPVPDLDAENSPFGIQ